MEHCRSDTDKGKSNYLKKKKTVPTSRFPQKKIHTDCARTEIGHPQGRNLVAAVKTVVALHRINLR